MRRTISQLLVLTGLFVFVGAGSAQAQKSKGDRDKITTEDMADAPGLLVTATDVVRVLRPNWLNSPRASSSMLLSAGPGAAEVVIYIDGMRQPSLKELDHLKASDIFEMKFLDQNRAIQEHGPGHELGVIEVTTIYKKKK